MATAYECRFRLEQIDRLHMVKGKPFIPALRNRASELILVASYAGHAGHALMARSASA
jgi:hypothetical protein